MRTASYLQSNNHLSLVKPPHVHRTVEADNSSTHSSRVLELTNVLQTTLKINLQIELFARKLRQHIKIDGMTYQLPDGDSIQKTGRITVHRATYDLRIEKQKLGTICFYRDKHLSKKEVTLLESLLCALVYPLRNALEYSHAMELASHDALTGIHNRHAMDEALNREIDLANRQSTPLSILILDADHFKNFNDTYGHAYGDEVLKTIADTIAATIRGSDQLFRFGGEEFVVLTSQTVSDGAHLLAERIRKNIEAISQIDSINTHTTVSLGVATLLKNETAKQFFERADAALYQAKENGRNRTEVAEKI